MLQVKREVCNSVANIVVKMDASRRYRCMQVANSDVKSPKTAVSVANSDINDMA